ncbi:transcription regulatory protein SNF2 [Striga asiatica]|uniref:Transcription regulatory protein SNF2 n=1 Tax=Striga asiatica TaxID=4170 RepID=A0A5A7P001_STRAF|nr:transcription regulatory protein SNF2 [Striga asiatica]
MTRYARHAATSARPTGNPEAADRHDAAALSLVCGTIDEASPGRYLAARWTLAPLVTGARTRPSLAYGCFLLGLNLRFKGTPKGFQLGLRRAITLPHRRLQLHLREPPSPLHSSASPPPPAIHPAAAHLRFPESSSDVFFLFVRTTSPIVRLTPALRSPVIPSVHRRDHLCGIPLSGHGFFQRAALRSRVAGKAGAPLFPISSGVICTDDSRPA